MLELYLAIGLIGLGALANKNGKQKRTAVEKKNKGINLNQDNIYGIFYLLHKNMGQQLLRNSMIVPLDFHHTNENNCVPIENER